MPGLACRTPKLPEDADPVHCHRLPNAEVTALKGECEVDGCMYFRRLAVHFVGLVSPLAHGIERSRGKRSIRAGNDFRVFDPSILADRRRKHDRTRDVGRARHLRIEQAPARCTRTIGCMVIKGAIVTLVCSTRSLASGEGVKATSSA